MKEIRHSATVAIAVCCLLCDAFATDRFFNDTSTESPSKRYTVEAKSPDNANKRGRNAFQSAFVYTCRETSTKHILWTRKQGEEASPVDVVVSDAGWTVIRTGWDELIAVDLAGHDRCRIRLLSEAFTKDERSRYVHDTTAGPMWSGFSLWYFLDADGQHLFVVRPWWGRRVLLNLETGSLTNETKNVSTAVAAFERSYVMTELAKVQG